MTEEKHKCSQEGCESTETTPCSYPSDEETPEEIYYYCFEHAHENGFCWGCGGFWAGVESFDFPSAFGNIPGLCENCNGDLGEDAWEDEDQEIYGFCGMGIDS